MQTFITDFGSNNSHLDEIAKDIFCFTSLLKVLDCRWNGFLERLIRELAITVRSLITTTGVFSVIFFRNVDSRWGPFTVDCVASHANAELSRFYSRFYNPKVGCCWLFPSVYLITQVIEHLKLCKRVGALVVPSLAFCYFLAMHR